ncbi:DUF1799 domain-containing protein [Pseudomonas sp. NPDC087358]|uniref:DUF1799 domain-containing protein n=1 Tax=Pseudomonas sp. NPDC087358 TaxID=3364439 RepID=UPI00384DD197
MYEPGPSDEHLAAFGMTRADIPDETFEVLPDVWPAFLTFNAMSTQWRVGMGGAVGLDYGAISAVTAFLGLSKKQTARLFPDLRVLEAEALLVMSESK